MYETYRRLQSLGEKEQAGVCVTNARLLVVDMNEEVVVETLNKRPTVRVGVNSPEATGILPYDV